VILICPSEIDHLSGRNAEFQVASGLFFWVGHFLGEGIVGPKEAHGYKKKLKGRKGGRRDGRTFPIGIHMGT
jgi:hypothetical protein